MNVQVLSTIFLVIDLSGSMLSGAKLLIVRNLIDIALFLLRRSTKYSEDFPLRIAYAYSSVEEFSFSRDENLPAPSKLGGTLNLVDLSKIIKKYSDTQTGPIYFFTDQVSHIPVMEHFFVIPIGDEIPDSELENRDDIIVPQKFMSSIECLLENGALP